MATKKAGGSVKNGRDSWSKRLGIKKNNLEIVGKSFIIVRGFKKIYPFHNVLFSKNYNLVSGSDKGFTKYITINNKKYLLVI